MQRGTGLTVVAMLALLAPWPLAASAAEYEVTIYRDSWGVPHIYGDSAESAAYGSGYAQAEDRLEELLAAYLLAKGQLARVFGEQLLERDVIARIARHAELSRLHYPRLRIDTRRLVEAFVAGVRAQMRDNPERVPAWAELPEPADVVALYRAFAYAWPFGQARGDLENRGSHVNDGRGSNQWIVGASRSALGAPIAFIDPHLAWDAQSLFYEAHVHGGNLNFFGFGIIGTPIMALGHTDRLSWGLTTGGPDCADVYEEKIDPENPLRYEYDGEWREIAVEEIEIEVATDEGPRKIRRTVERTRHGPILARDGDRAFAFRTAYDEEIGIVEQWFDMARARNLGEFIGAMRANQSLPQNILYADVDGNLYYLRAGRVPIRPPGFDWDRPVPGWTSETEWRGIHPLADLVQMFNPPGGLMQNCNISPGTMVPDFVLSSESYPSYIYNAGTGRSNGRSRRALQLLNTEEKLTLDRAIEIALDTFVDRSDRWQAALRAAYLAHESDFSDLMSARDLLLAWDGRTDVTSRGAVLFRAWLRAARRPGSGVSPGQVEHGRALDEARQIDLLEALRAAVAELTEVHGRIDVPWGDVHRIGRGGRSWPVGGCSADGIGTLRSVRFDDPDEAGISWANGGQMSVIVAVLREGDVESYSLSPFGQSSEPGSPHYVDQAEQLFGPGRLKPTWYDRESLLEHVESTKTLRPTTAELEAVRP